MKRFLSFLAVFSCFTLILVSCGENQKDTSKGNLNENQGTNEVSGNSYYSGEDELTFNSSTVYYGTYDGGSSNNFARAVTDNSYKEKFIYSYNSTNKTLEFQLTSVWDTNAGQNYLAALNAKKALYTDAANSVVDTINKLDLSSYDNIITYQCSLLNRSEPSTKFSVYAKSYITNKAKAYISSQESALETYLNSKYNAVIHFNYQLDESGNLTLDEQFNGDLTDASSYFAGTDIYINDYENLVPFYIKVSESEYTGVPVITKTSGTSGTVKVTLIPYYGDCANSTNQTAFVSTITNKASSIFSGISSDDLQTIGTEYILSGSSSTFEGLVNDVFNSSVYVVEFSYTYDSENQTLTLTKTENTTLSSVSYSYNLTYTPTLSANITFTKE